MKLLDRYILAELAFPFGFGVVAFTAILTASTQLFHLVTLMVRHGLAPGLVAEVLALRLPEMVFYTFPMATLLASLMAFGRLAGDGEITALKAAGVSLYRMITPVMAFALVSGAIAVGLNETLVPKAAWRAKGLMYEAMNRKQLPAARDHLFYQEMEEGHPRRFFYARHFDGSRMRDVMVQEFENGRLVRLIQAADAYPANGAWRFERGVVHQVDERGEFRFSAKFEVQQVALGEALLALGRENRQPNEMTAAELDGHIARLMKTGQRGREIDELRVLWHQKFAVPSASLVFALLGAPLGLRPHSGGSAMGLGLSVLVIFVYYVLMFVAMACGQTGTLPPWLGAWLPNIVCMALGIYHLRLLARH